MNTSQNSQVRLQEAIDLFLDTVRLSRAQNTHKAYRNALARFSDTLEDHELSLTGTFARQADPEWVSWFARALKDLAPATERLYLSAASRFFEFLVAENLADINLPRVKLLINTRGRRPGTRLPQFPRESIELIVKYITTLAQSPVDDPRQRLRNLRDRAFLITLADTGLRVHEACQLRRGEIDWNEAKALIIGKGSRQALVRFSPRALAALRDYIHTRAALDGASGKPLATLPVFARHDKRASTKVLPMSTTTGRNIVVQRVRESLGEEAVGTITPHSFRHYFVTAVLRGTGGNLKMAQELARHQNIQVTQRYAHLSADELDRGYDEVFGKEK